MSNRRIAAKPAPGIPLSRVVEVLQSDEGQPLVERLMEPVHAYGRWEHRPQTHEFIARPASRPLPEDAFERAVVQGVDGCLDVFFEPLERPVILPAIVADVLAPLADAEGKLRPSAFPPGGARDFLLQVEEVLNAPASGEGVLSPRPGMTFSYAAPETQRTLLRSSPLETFASRMPVIQRLVEKYGGPRALEGWTMGEQAHQLKHSLPKLSALEDCGARIAFNTGKSYSTPKEVHAHLMHLKGLWGEAESPARRKESNETRMYLSACDRLDSLFAGEDDSVASKGRFHLFSDGAYLLRAMHEEPRFQKYLSRCVGAEQTQFGGEYVEALEAKGELGMDVGAMWRCEAKKRFESPSIGESVLFHMETYLAETGPDIRLDSTKPAVIVGGGAVGKACADALERRGFPRSRIVFIESNAEWRAALFDGPEHERYGSSVPRDVLEKAHLLGTAERAQVLGMGDVLITATPGQSVASHEWSLLKDGCKVANAGSGNHAFGCDDTDALSQAETPELFFGVDGDVYGQFQGNWAKLGPHLTLSGEDTRHRILRTPEGKELFFFRSGYVVNFGKGGLPPEISQLTNGLILAFQLLMTKNERPPESVGPGKGRIVSLPPEVEAELVAWTQEALAAYGTSLENPDFRKLPAWF